MLISVITPTYKRLNYIKKNFEQISLIQKKFKNIEWIIVIEEKDKSTIDFFKKRKKKFIKTVVGSFGSAEIAYERGIKKSKGKYLNLHGDDDFFHTEGFYVKSYACIQLLQNEYIVNGVLSLLDIMKSVLCW